CATLPFHYGSYVHTTDYW
nr:immunoglobulin heavy chain junction region [Macaca mulatta]MOV39552.1 immunoglobulin heavy chain junction region [Macaca mulatta]